MENVSSDIKYIVESDINNGIEIQSCIVPSLNYRISRKDLSLFYLSTGSKREIPKIKIKDIDNIIKEINEIRKIYCR